MFWNVTLCSPLNVNRDFLCLLPDSSWFLIWLHLRPVRFRWFNLDELHGVKARKQDLLQARFVYFFGITLGWVISREGVEGSDRYLF
jgi:hypothetical protein